MAYERQVGLFGSIRKLGVTTIAGANDVILDTIGVVTDATGSARVVSSLTKSAVAIWGNNLLQDLEADAEIDGIHRQIAMAQQNAELVALKAELAKATKVTRTKTVVQSTTK